jgi:lysozyme
MVFWQHTEVGSVPGTHAEADLNVFTGTHEDLEAHTIK